jgi:hypothetical protein
MSNEIMDVWGRTFAQAGSPDTFVKLKELQDVTPQGEANRAISLTTGGINHRQLPVSIPINKDYYGLAFFTKPDMRLTDNNVSRNRVLTPMLSTDPLSWPRIIRASLDARHDKQGNESYLCPLVDPKQVFIPLLSNQLISMSGWQDVELPTHTTEAGLYGEAFSYADGIASIYRTYDITANFRNLPGDPITAMFYYWAHYASAVFQGTLTPWPSNLKENVVDYQTRIWRLVLDNKKRYVQKIACTGPAFPVGVSMGEFFNYELDTPINRRDQITISFRAIGAEYQDPILIIDFNKTVIIGNEDMADNMREQSGMVKIPFEYIYLFNHMGYPRINPITYELEWWVYNEQYVKMTGEQDATEQEVNTDMIDADGLGEYLTPDELSNSSN